MKEEEKFKNEITKWLGYGIVLNAMVLVDVAFVALLKGMVIPPLAIELIKAKLALGVTLLLGVKYLKSKLKGIRIVPEYHLPREDPAGNPPKGQ